MGLPIQPLGCLESDTFMLFHPFQGQTRFFLLIFFFFFFCNSPINSTVRKKSIYSCLALPAWLCFELNWQVYCHVTVQLKLLEYCKSLAVSGRFCSSDWPLAWTSCSESRLVVSDLLDGRTCTIRFCLESSFEVQHIRHVSDSCCHQQCPKQ